MELKQRLQRKKLWKSLKLQLIRQETFSKKHCQYLYWKKRVTGGGIFLYARKKTDNWDNSRKCWTQDSRWSGQKQDRQFHNKLRENKPNCNLIQHVSRIYCYEQLEKCPPMNKKFVLRKNSGSTPNRKVKIFHNKSRNTNTRLKYLVSSKSLQNIILNGSSTTEKANGDLLSTKPTATDFGRNSENVEKGCTKWHKWHKNRAAT